MKICRWISAPCLLALALLLGGCETGGEYDAKKVGQNVAKTSPNEKPPAASCAPVKAALSDAQAAYGPDDQLIKAEFLEIASNSPNAFGSFFQAGDELFGKAFTAAQGGGANVGGHQRYTRVPRADRICAGEWANHQPPRATGPNGQSCVECHNRPNDGSGGIVANAQRDPLHSGKTEQMIQRNTPHLFGGGALQLLATEMSADLLKIRDEAGMKACASGQAVVQQLVTKTVSYGAIKATCQNGAASFDYTEIQGISRDLIVKPFQWKKTFTTVREFVLDATHNELGMQGVEMFGPDGKTVDGDGDGVVNELTVPQVTALTVYMAAQPRPTTRLELTELNVFDDDAWKRVGFEPVTEVEERQEIEQGQGIFAEIGCATCHKPQLTLSNTQFTEPNGAHRPISFDLAKDTPDNQETNGGKLSKPVLAGAFTEKDGEGKTLVRLYGDLKRHDMGPELAESIDEPIPNAAEGIGKSTFGTKDLWGVGCSGPWLHDGRATTLTEAILYHGGEGANSRTAFKTLDAAKKHALFSFLYNQVFYLREDQAEPPSDRAVCGKADDEPKG